MIICVEMMRLFDDKSSRGTILSPKNIFMKMWLTRTPLIIFVQPPWHECEQVLQIVFRVGSGWPPTIPPSVQADESCHSFLKLCFQANPLERATAGQLRQHAFANINASFI